MVSSLLCSALFIKINPQFSIYQILRIIVKKNKQNSFKLKFQNPFIQLHLTKLWDGQADVWMEGDKIHSGQLCQIKTCLKNAHALYITIIMMSDWPIYHYENCIEELAETIQIVVGHKFMKFKKRYQLLFTTLNNQESLPDCEKLIQVKFKVVKHKTLHTLNKFSELKTINGFPRQ